MTRVSPDWLGLREPADASARSTDLVEQLVERLPTADPLVIHDLGCGTGAVGRWLAPLLPGAQHWVLHDHDDDLLEIAAAEPPAGALATVETRQSDITRLRPGELCGASLVTASALLDMLTEDELGRTLTACLEPRCPMLLTLSVVGHVELSPGDPLDHDIGGAFNAHQRTGRLGPDAIAVARDALGHAGAEVVIRPSPWRLGAADAELTAGWLTGWVAAACEQQPELAADARGYERRRLAQAAAGELEVSVGHADLLVLPAQSSSNRDESA